MPDSANATRPAPSIAFAHNSERQFARLLDFYQLEWEYEPTAFPIEWDGAGNPTQQFRPDFYLPAYDLYIEITTLNQRLVTKKNRKVRRMRELYPQVRIKVLYQRDYLSLLAKYGLEPPSQMQPGPPPLPRPALASGALDGPLVPSGDATRPSGAPAVRARAAGRPRALPAPPQAPPPLPADPELVRLAEVPLPAELAQRRPAGRAQAS
jgi:hypothetical protein